MSNGTIDVAVSTTVSRNETRRVVVARSVIISGGGPRGAGDDPRSLVPRDEFVVGDPSGEAQPSRRAERVGGGFEALPMGAVADDHRLQFGYACAYVRKDREQIVQSLLRHHARDGKHQRA